MQNTKLDQKILDQDPTEKEVIENLKKEDEKIIGFLNATQANQDFGIDDMSATTSPVTSLLGEESEEDINGTLLGSVADTASFVEVNNDVMSEEEIRIREKYFLDPVNQANILFDNYVREQPIALNRRQKRDVYQQFLKNAKKGMYKKIFNEQIYGVSKEKADSDFSKLNG